MSARGVDHEDHDTNGLGFCLDCGDWDDVEDEEDTD